MVTIILYEYEPCSEIESSAYLIPPHCSAHSRIFVGASGSR